MVVLGIDIVGKIPDEDGYVDICMILCLHGKVVISVILTNMVDTAW
jgi:hypothetical protein